MGIVLPEGVFNNPSLAYVREFCEDRAFIRAVVSLAQETFYSSGASVKASLLFLQKFTEKEQAEFNKKREQARKEIDARYAKEIDAETQRLNAAIDAAKQARDADKRKAAQRELAEYLRAMDAKKEAQARVLLKERFAYPVFMYEAEKVGITATGEADQNELYPNENTPPDSQKTCVELYCEFQKDPNRFFVNSSGGSRLCRSICRLVQRVGTMDYAEKPFPVREFAARLRIGSRWRFGVPSDGQGES